MVAALAVGGDARAFEQAVDAVPVQGTASLEGGADDFLTAGEDRRIEFELAAPAGGTGDGTRREQCEQPA